MITYKEIMLRDMKKEMKILKHLYTKITPELMDYRPQEGMRSIKDLLNYLSYCSMQVLYFYSSKETDKELFYSQLRALMKEAVEQPDFPSALDFQYKHVVEMLDNISENDIMAKDVGHGHFKEKVNLGVALQHSAFKNLTAYRMQLFLYLKMSGQKDLDTYNNWKGYDRPTE